MSVEDKRRTGPRCHAAAEPESEVQAHGPSKFDVFVLNFCFNLDLQQEPGDNTSDLQLAKRLAPSYTEQSVVTAAVCARSPRRSTVSDTPSPRPLLDIFDEAAAP